DVSLTTEAAFAANFACDASNFGGEGTQLLDHGVERFFQLQNFATHVHGDFSGKVAAGNSGSDFSDIAYLASQVAGHEVDVVGQILPRAADVGHLRLTAKL